MAPTTLPGQQTTSSPCGRDVETMGLPLQMSEMLAGLPGAAYVVRRSLHNVREILKARKAVKLAFQTQITARPTGASRRPNRCNGSKSTCCRITRWAITRCGRKWRRCGRRGSQ
jgi:hypothetical protein